MTESPIFITGMYRSGTTLLSRILNAHKDLSITYDSLHFMRYIYKKYGKNKILKKNIDNVLNFVIKRVENRTGKLLIKNNIKKKLLKKKIIKYNFFYQLIMKDFLIEKSGSKHWGEKTNIAWKEIPNFFDMFNKGKVIFLIRDPRDILISYKKMTSYEYPDYLSSIFLCLGSFQFLEKLSKSNFFKNILIIKYEDLISNKDYNIKLICNFLNIKSDKKMLEIENFVDLDGSKWKPNSSFKKFNNFSKTPIGRWKNNIKIEDLFLLELVLKKYLIKYKYTPSNCKFSENIMKKSINKISKSNSLVKIFETWIETGNGQHEFMHRDW